MATAVSLLLATTGTVAAGEQPPLSRFERSQILMGTTFRIVLYSADEGSATVAIRLAFDRVAELERVMSDYLDTSELTALNEAAGGPAKVVSQDLFDVLQRAQAFSKLTDGAFDVTVGPATQLWRRSRRSRRLPPPERVKETLMRVGYEKLVLNPSDRSVRLSVPQMRLDLGGIGKGYACDAALAVLKQRGITRALVDGGGGITCGDPPPERDGWAVAFGPPVVSASPTKKQMFLSNRSVATSGDFAQYVNIRGIRYSHIVNPKTGLGTIDGWQATVVAKDGTTADALATALCVLGPEKGLPIVEKTDGAACYLSRETAKGPESHASKRWKELRIVTDISGIPLPRNK